MSLLVMCRACARHIRSHEASCPFCRAPAAPSAAALSPAPSPRRLRGEARLSRAALVLAGLGALEGCGKTPAGAPDAAPDAELVAAPPYGAPPNWPIEPAIPEARDAGAAQQLPRPPYGAPPPLRDGGRPGRGKLPDME